jgi:hypothetical protein
MFKAGLELILLTEDDGTRAAYATELKTVLYRYLGPHVGTGPVEIGEEEKAAARSSLAAGGALWFDGPPREMPQDVAYRPAPGDGAGEATPAGLPTSR